MVRVQQGVQNRHFKYDPLGRLIRVSQPEQEPNAGLAMSDPYNGTGQWTAGFTYDVVGNVLTTTNANGVTITNAYDKASRVKTRIYSGEPSGQTTPSVNFFYDGKGLASEQSPNYAKGKLTKVENTVSRTLYKQFDNFGRLKEMEQRTPIGTETIGDAKLHISKYLYNLSGALIEEEYPSGRKVQNAFESDGDLLHVASQETGSQVSIPYATNFSYTPSGGIKQMRLGNGRWETAKFNARLQVTELGLGNSAIDASAWKVGFDYGELGSSGTVDATKNTGNIAKQTLTIPGTSFVQTYRYDSLYRLTDATETSGSTTNWTQTFGYDRYGNRTSFAQSIASTTTNTTPTVNANTNRFVISGTNFQYDFNGNLVRDSEGRQFTFNGENKQTVVRDASSNIIGRYFYDGEGKRVKKKTDTEETVFVYSSGKLVAEFSAQLSLAPSVSYTTTDHLGSPRVITNQLGQVKSRRDFMPFGEETIWNVGARNSNPEYSSGDNLRQKFTGYQKDNETGLDFAEARMYENRHGRFTAVDPMLASGKSANPQTFNRYVYVGNNPVVITDPWGLDWYSKYYEESGRTDYEWFDSDPGNGWGAVDFGGFSSLYLRIDNVCIEGQCNSTRYLGRYGGSLTPEQFEESQARQQTLALFFGTYSSNDPKQLAARDSGVRAASADVMWSAAPFANIPSGTYNLGAWGINALGGELPYAPTITPDESTSPGGNVFYYGTNVALIAQGGSSLLSSVRSGVSSFRAGGSTFGERLFNSSAFGKESRLFGNKLFDSTGNRVSGSLNVAGRRFKAGWSSVQTEKTLFDRPVNTLAGGGQQFRIGFGRADNTRQAAQHFYIPRTFVPNSVANPYFVP